MKIPKAIKLPSGRWNVRIRIKSGEFSVTRPTEAEAVAEAMAIKAGLKQPSPTQKNITLARAMDEYIDGRENILSPATIRAYRTIRYSRLQSAMSLPIKSATKAQWQTAINLDTKDGISPKTVRNAWGLVASILRANEIPVPDVRLPQQMPNEHPYLTPEQVATFMWAIRGHWVELPALLGLHSLRRSEICGLTWQDIDLVHRSIKVRRALVFAGHGEWVTKNRTKTANSTREIPILIDRLADLLAEQKRPNGQVVKCHPSAIHKAVNRICSANRLPLIGTHGLRHSFASLCKSVGVPEETTMLLGGWSDYQTMRKRYTHFSQAEVRSHIDSLREFFLTKENADENADENPQAPDSQSR